MVEVVRTIHSCNLALYHPWTVGIYYGTEQISPISSRLEIFHPFPFQLKYFVRTFPDTLKDSDAT
jgi:hypothetical protein